MLDLNIAWRIYKYWETARKFSKKIHHNLPYLVFR